MDEFPASKLSCTYNLQPDLLESFPADVCPDITVQFGCDHRAKFSPSGEGWGGGGSVGNWCGLRAKFTQSVGEGEEWKRFLTNRESRG